MRGESWFRTNRAYRWWIVGLALVIIGPHFVAEGMELDGTIFSTIARNMAEGRGTYWKGYLSETLYPVFWEHPPLQFWQQAALVRLFGDSLWVDKIYPVFVGVASLALVVVLWRQLTPRDSDARRMTWLPLLLVLASPGYFFLVANNQLEDGLMFYGLAATSLQLAAMEPRREAARVGLLVASGLMISAAALTKGPPGTFPLVATGIFWLATGRPGFLRACVHTLVVLATIAAVLGIFGLFDEPRAFFTRYLHEQLIASINGDRGTVGGGPQAILRLLETVAVPCLIALGIGLTGLVWRRRVSAAEPLRPGSGASFRTGAAMILLALAGSVPILLSARIWHFYFYTSIPFYALGLALWCAPFQIWMMKRLPARFYDGLEKAGIAFVGVAALATAAAHGHVWRHQDQIADVKAIGAYLCANGGSCAQRLPVCGGAPTDHVIHVYFERYFRISLDWNAQPGRYLLQDAACGAPPPGYVSAGLDLQRYKLLVRRDRMAGTTPPR